MATGILVRHPTFKGGLMVVPLITKPLTPPMACLTCQTTHPVKTLHLNIDGNGECLVSEGVLALMQEAGALPPFTIQGSTSHPPAQTIGFRGNAAEVLPPRPVHIDLDEGVSRG